MRTTFQIRTAYTLVFLLVIFFSPKIGLAQASCVAPKALTPGTTCTNVVGDLKGATNAAPTGSCGGATAATTYGVWFKFTAGATTEIITTATTGASLTAATTYVELLNGTCGSFTSLYCQNATAPIIASGLTTGTAYYLRVYVITPPANTINVYKFNICIQNVPANDECTGSINLSSAAACSNTAGTLDNSTTSTGLPAGCESAGTHYDVWYTVKPSGSTEIFTLSSLGANFTNPELQLYDGSCGSLTSLACGTNTMTVSGLIINHPYYLRVSQVGTSPWGGGTFNICAYNPMASVEISRSYINLSKINTGGTVNPGDTLEMRATFVVGSNNVDSLAYYDTLYAGRGLRLIPGSLALRTNEDLVYTSYTDVKTDADGGWAIPNGADTIIQMNFGANSNKFKRGSLTNASRPSVFNGTCILMVTYRVVVYAPYNTKINFKNGAISYRDPYYNVVNHTSFPNDSLIVYQSPGLCPNAVSATNAIGIETNGTFGAPPLLGPTPLSQNRGTSIYTNYKYMPFSTTGGPSDYFYGIANNTSAAFSIATNWPKPDPSATAHRVFGVWDIMGDHTGAINPVQGNPPCDTSKPVSATNPCGYMIVINSAYKTDTAFQYTATNLCPNTYYEIGAWFKNVCYKCGCDSLGRGTGSPGYLVTVPGSGDSSGIKPNIAFDVDGVDYYNTGDIKYVGTAPTTSDGTNIWVKRGFTYLTGVAQTSLTLTVRNNAPGGGGNDWAMDDIAINTCLPNMKYSPSLNPSTCQNNTVQINDTIQSYFNTYANYKWQKSIDNGSTWVDVAGTSGVGSPTWNGSAYQYISSYTIPPTSTNVSDSGTQYRVIVSTTSGNLANSNCQVTDGVSNINLKVINCGIPLASQLLSFNGKLVNNYSNLFWSTTNEGNNIAFEIEKSNDGTNFRLLNTVRGKNSSTNNFYFLVDSALVTSDVWYRIVLTNKDGGRNYSRIIQLSNHIGQFDVTNIINPFNSNLLFNVNLNEDARIDVALLTLSGTLIKRQSFTSYNGSNSLYFNHLDALAPGIYVLQISNKDKTIIKKVVKQ